MKPERENGKHISTELAKAEAGWLAGFSCWNPRGRSRDANSYPNSKSEIYQKGIYNQPKFRKNKKLKVAKFGPSFFFLRKSLCLETWLQNLI